MVCGRVQNHVGRQTHQHAARPPGVGDIRVVSGQGNDVVLAYRGWQILSEFARYDAQVLGISIDTVPTIKAWAKSLGGISYPLLSDFWPHGHTALKFAVLRAEGFTERALFIIDKQSKIRYIDIHAIGDQPKNSVLFEELKKIQG